MIRKSDYEYQKARISALEYRLDQFDKQWFEGRIFSKALLDHLKIQKVDVPSVPPKITFKKTGRKK